MKKLSAIVLSAIICVALFGCSADKAQFNENETAQATVTAISTTQSESTIDAVSENKTTDRQSTSAPNNRNTSTSSPKENNEDNASNTDEKTTIANNNTTANNLSNKPASSKPTTTARQTTTSSTITCSVTIECTSVLDNMDELKAGHEDYVPSDGYIISNYSVTLPNDSTAYDAVKAACENRGVTMNVVSSSYGKYIAGFNNIDEKDCGNQSGWLYFVNGKSPSKSCNKYTLSNGDNVVFSYTC
ncbi:MAG: DUF4430 domain-containing protein [Eubacterium sp.]|nr:DUF4430 domain-containing protein [Eubacterium sp.]MDE6155525.1 DUF4430 domain-containing protein [Eubacterium sp.]MDE6767900.1 DUF4430 domain-containing protein [Eubacterium sp.]